MTIIIPIEPPPVINWWDKNYEPPKPKPKEEKN